MACARMVALSILENHSQCHQFFCIRISASCCFGRYLDGSLNSHRPLLGYRVDESELMRSISLRSSEGSDQFAMGNGWIHKHLDV